MFRCRSVALVVPERRGDGGVFEKEREKLQSFGLSM